eukprot:1976744-Prymnesium_polylepis.1
MFHGAARHARWAESSRMRHERWCDSVVLSRPLNRWSPVRDFRRSSSRRRALSRPRLGVRRSRGLLLDLALPPLLFVSVLLSGAAREIVAPRR